jgi:hypothetical protein
MKPRYFALLLIPITALFVLQPSIPGHMLTEAPSAAPSRAPVDTPTGGQTSVVQNAASVEPDATGGVGENDCVQWQVNAGTLKDVSSVLWCAGPHGDCRGGQFRIRVSVWPSPRALSNNAALSTQLAERFGPFFFRLRLEGPEALLLTPSPDAKTREYVATLPSEMLGGEYRVGLELLYRDYNAADERTKQWPPLLKAPILSLMETRTNYHMQQMTLLSKQLVFSSGPTDGAAANSPELPLCDGHGAHAGRWRAAPGKVFTRVRVKKIQREPIVFQWAIQEDLNWQWVRWLCRSRRGSYRALLRGLKGKRIAIGGDSQLRALYYGIVNTLLGHSGPCIRELKSVDKEPPFCIQNVKGSQRRDIAGVQVDYVDDLFLDKFAGGRYDGYDVVIVGFGQHPASKEHWTMDKYRGSVAAKAKKVQQYRDAGVTVVWYGAPQYPHTTNGYPVVVRDWRTDARLELFNEIAFAAMKELQVSVVDAFAATTVMSHTSPDQAHYSNFVCAELVNIVFDAVCAALPSACAE